MLEVFFAKHPVFSSKDFSDAFPETNPLTAKNSLAYHMAKGHLGRVRRGLFYTVPPGEKAEQYPVDPFLVAANLAPDAVICLHSALSFHGIAYSIFNEFTYFTKHGKSRSLVFQGSSFKAIEFAKALLTSKMEMMGVVERERQGLSIKVTSLERTLVDALDRIDQTGGLEEVWRSLETISYLTVDDVIKYALALKNSSTISKVGYFLSLNQEKFMVSNGDLRKLRKNIPSSPHYMLRRKRSGGVFVPDWNLMVPQELVNKSWEEPESADFA